MLIRLGPKHLLAYEKKAVTKYRTDQRYKKYADRAAYFDWFASGSGDWYLAAIANHRRASWVLCFAVVPSCSAALFFHVSAEITLPYAALLFAICFPLAFREISCELRNRDLQRQAIARSKGLT